MNSNIGPIKTNQANPGVQGELHSYSDEVDGKSYFALVKIQGSSSSPETDVKIRRIFKYVVQSQEFTTAKGDRTITINRDDLGNVVIGNGVHAIQLTISLPDENSHEESSTTFKMMKISREQLKPAFKQRTVTDAWQKACGYLIGKIPIIQVFWGLFAVPYFLIKRVIDISSLTTDATPRGERSLETAMREILQIAQATPGDDHKGLKEALKEGLNVVQACRNRHASVRRRGVSTLADKICKICGTPLQDQPAKESSSGTCIAAIPGGYWTESATFEPILWSFFNENGSLQLTGLSYSDDTVETHLKYSFNSPLDKKNVEQVLNSLMEMTKKTKDGKTDQLNSLANLSAPAAPLLENKEQEQVAIADHPKTKTKEDPIKLLQQFIQTRFPEVPLADKALLTMQVFNAQIRKVLTSLEGLSPSERQDWLEKLENDYERLNRQVEKAGGVSLLEKTFEVFADDLKQLRVRIKHLSDANPAVQDERMKALDCVNIKPFELRVSLNQDTPDEKNPVLASRCAQAQVTSDVYTYCFEELDALNRVLSSDVEAPLEVFLSDVMLFDRLKEDYTTEITTESIHEVFDHILQNPSILDSKRPNAHLVQGYQGQRRICRILLASIDLLEAFQPKRNARPESLLEKALEETPEYFLGHSEAIKEHLENCLKSNNSVRFFSSLFFIDTTYQHMQSLHHQYQQMLQIFKKDIEDIQKNPNSNNESFQSDIRKKEEQLIGYEKKKQELTQMLDKWPNRQTLTGRPSISFLERAIDLWEREEDFQVKIDGAAYLLGLFRKQSDVERGATPLHALIENPKTVAALLKANTFLELTAESATLPFIAKEGRQWMNEHLAPHINSMENQDQRNAILSAWVGDQDPGQWQKVAGQEMVWDNGDIQVDLATKRILKGANSPSKEIEIPIPSAVAQHPNYRSIFGETLFTCIAKSTNKQEVFDFHIKDDQGTSFKLTYNTSDKSLLVERKKEDAAEWERFCRPQVNTEETSSAFEKLLVESGMWLNVTAQTTGSIEIRLDPHGPITPLQVQLNADRNIEALFTEDDLEVVHNPSGFSDVLACLPSEHILFLRKRETKAVTEIRFLNQTCALKRESESEPWTFSSPIDHLNGANWVMGNERGLKANELLGSTGISVEQTGFTVRKGDKTHIILWPHLATRGKNHLLFKQEKQVDPPLTISVADDGREQSTCGGFLQLAYLFAAQHKYDKAALYLEKARAGKIGHEQELNQILKLETLCKQLPVTSARSAAIRLKVLLVIRRIIKEQTQQPGFSEAKWITYLHDLRGIAATYTSYLAYIKSFSFKNKQTYFNLPEIDVAFTSEEATELNDLIAEDMRMTSGSDLHVGAYDPIEIVKARETEVKARIQQLEQKRPAKTSEPAEAFASLNPPFLSETVPQDKMSDEIRNLFTEQTNETKQRNIEHVATRLWAVELPQSLKDGVKEAESKLVAASLARHSITSENVLMLRQKIDTLKSEKQQRIEVLKKDLMDNLKNSTTSCPSLLRALRLCKKNQDMGQTYGEEHLLHAAKQAYQRMELNNLEVENLLTELLLEKTALGVLNREVEDHLQSLESLRTNQGVTTTDEWIAASTRIFYLMDRALNFSRYSNNEGALLSPSLHRKVLVLEASPEQEMVLTTEQLQLIEEMVANPEDWYELKVGLGKTSVVLPILLLMLIEKGERPTCVVKDELLAQNLDSMDRATRDLLGKAGVQFRLTVQEHVTGLMLQEQYLRLLEVRSEGGYPITSKPSLDAIDQRLQLLNKRLSGDKDLNNDDRKELKKQQFYLVKIRKELDLRLFDEADDILNILSENIIGTGKVVRLNPAIQQTMEHLMRMIHTSTELHVVRLREALTKGQQAALSEGDIRDKLIPACAKGLLNDQDFLNTAGLNQQNLNIDTLVALLCQTFEPNAKPQQTDSLSDNPYLGALQRVLQNHLPTALRQRPNIDVGVKASDHFQLGPQVNSNEKVGTVFGDEFDLIVNHYLFYSLSLPEDTLKTPQEESFVMKGLLQLHKKNSSKYNEWCAAANCTQEEEAKVLAYLQQPEQVTQRMEFLNLHIIQEMRLRRYDEQIVFNAQDLGYKIRVGGTTGTLNRDSMPVPQARLNQDIAVQSKTVTAEVILEAAVLGNPKVVSIAETEVLNQMIKTAKDTNVKAIINQGYYIPPGDSRSIVEKLRSDSPQRIFVYVDTKTRQPMIWKPEDLQPRQVSKLELNQLSVQPAFKTKSCFYFSPADTRGTDFRIPPGRGACFLSPRCSTEDFVQALGRMRQSGKTHGMDFVMTDSMKERMNLGDKAPDYADLVADISREESKELKAKHLKAAIQALQTVVKMGSREMIYGSPEEETDNTMIQNMQLEFRQAFTDVATNPPDGWMEESRQAALTFAATLMCPTNEKLEAIYTKEVARIQKLKNALEDVKIHTDPMKTRELDNDNSAKGTPLQDVEAQTWRMQKIATLNTQIQEMETQLQNRYAYARKQLEQAIFPENLPSNSDGTPNAHAHVQEVQQQQQVQQVQQQQVQQVQQQQVELEQQTIRNMKIGKAWKYPRRYAEINSGSEIFKDGNGEKIIPDHNKRKLVEEFWNKHQNAFGLSEDCKYLFLATRGGCGNPQLFRILIQNNQIVVIARNDYHLIPCRYYSRFGPKDLNELVKYGRVVEIDSKRHKYADYDAIYTLHKGKLLLNKQHGRTEPEFTGELLKNLVITKWYLGITEYDEEEARILKTWIHEATQTDEDHQGMLAFLEAMSPEGIQKKMYDTIKKQGKSLPKG